jgi:glycosyltransferase involved in cell wall biosynthesis
MKISVIIACKNEKDTIEKTIDSVLNQTYKNFEILVLDGNSTDGTLEILKNYRERIKLLRNEEKGIYAAMNEGIRLSTGEILYFLNANDSLHSNDVFKKIINKFKETDVDIIFGDTNFQTKNENTLISHKDFHSKFVWAYRNLNHQSTFYKKWLFDKYGNYKSNFKILADVEFTTHVITQSEVKHLYLPIIIANYNAEGVSSYNNPENIILARKEKEIIAEKYLNFEYKLFQFYNFFFANELVLNFNEFLKRNFGLGLIYKIRDFKRSLGRTFIWWMRKI